MNRVTDNPELEAKYQLAMQLRQTDDAKAAQLLEEAAEEGHREAAYNLAICYHYGYGVEKDLKTAYQLYLRAALQGSGKGLTMVGDFYAEGLGVRQSWREAIKWYLDATVSDDMEAIGYAEYKLAGILARGNGVEVDPDGAVEWYEKALSHGELRAKEELEKLGGSEVVRVREARMEDAASIWQLSVLELGCCCGLAELQQRLQSLLKRDLICVAVSGGKVLGFVHACGVDTLIKPHCKQILALAAGKDPQVKEALLRKVELWAGDAEILQ